MGTSRTDSDSSDDDDSSYEKASFEFQGFLVTVVEPFLADLRNWSIELQKLLPPAVPDRPLGERNQLVLTVLRNEKALDSDHRMRTEDIASKAIGPAADANQFKEVIAKLKRLKYVDTKEGQRGECWLTVSGRERAEKL